MAALTPSAPALALVEVLDGDGPPSRTLPVHAWPLRIGRAFDNDLVLSDPHVAPYHLAIEDHGEAGLELVVGETLNGLRCDAAPLAAGQRHRLPADTGTPTELRLGRTTLRLLRPAHGLLPERPLAAEAPPRRRRPSLATVVPGVIAFGAVATSTWLDADPDNTARALGAALTSLLAGLFIWCGAWALLTKTFTGRSRFGWHLRVLLTASAAWAVIDTGSSLLAFALSWPWLSDFAFVAGYAVAAAALYGHLQAVEPARPRLMRGVAVAAFVVGTALSLWLQQQRQERLGSELYMSHLFPPALRLARPVAVGDFVDGLATLQPLLDARAKEPPRGGGASPEGSSDGE